MHIAYTDPLNGKDRDFAGGRASGRPRARGRYRAARGHIRMFLARRHTSRPNGRFEMSERQDSP